MLALIAGTLICASAMGTNGYFADGYGIKAEGEAGAGIAFPQDSLTIATNPAGLVALSDTFDVGADIFRPKRDATLVQGGGTQGYDGSGISTFYIPAIGYTRHVTQNLAAGFALFGNGGLDTYYVGNPFSRFGATGTAGVDLQQAFLSPALAWQANPQNSIGAALNVGYQRFRAKGIGLFASFSQDPSQVSDQGYDSAYGAGARVGWIGHVNQYLAVGATWQSTTWMQKFKKYAGLFANGGNFDAPSTYGVGLALTPNAAWTVALDWQEIRYGDVPSVGDPVNSLFSGVPLGATNGPGFGWHNVSVIKLGLSYQVDAQWTIRAGVSYDDQPIPRSQTFFNILAPGVIETHLTAGFSWRVNPKNELSLSILHAPRKTINGAGSIPPSFGGGEANISLVENSIGLGWSYQP